MESPKSTKQECTRLGIFSTALAVGTFCSVVGRAGVGVPVTVLGTILESFAGGIVADEVGATTTAIPPVI